MRLQDVMSKPLLMIGAGESAVKAWDLMRVRGVHHLGVSDGRLFAGVISAEDLGGPKGSAVREGKTVRELMSRAFETASPRTTVREAANLLRGRHIGCVPVLERGKPVGIVTVSDLLDLIGRGAERPVPMGKLRERVNRRNLAKADGVARHS